MKLFGTLSEILSIVFRKNSQPVTFRPNQATTYTAARDVQIPEGDADHVIVSRTSTDTLTNKTLTSPTINTPTITAPTVTGSGTISEAIRFVDSSDNTKRAAFNVSTSAGTTTTIIVNGSVDRSVSIPNSAVSEDFLMVETLSAVRNKNLFDTSVVVVDATDTTKRIAFDAGGTTSTTTTLAAAQTANRTINLPDASTTLVGDTTSQTLTNKTLSNATLTGGSTTIQDGAAIIDTADATKRLQFDVGGTTATFTQINTAQTTNRTITLPDATTTLVGTDATQTLTNKTMGSTNTLTGATVASITNTGTVTFPTSTDTLVARATTDTLTNKDIDGGIATNTRRITLPKETTANLNALTRKEGTVVYDTTTGQVKFDNGITLAALSTTATATSTAQGTVTSFAPLIQASFNSVSNANYTVLDNDGYDTILVTTGASTRTVTLPTAADNDGRWLLIKKVDSGAGAVTVDGEGSETIDGSITVSLSRQYDSVRIKCDGANWFIASARVVNRIQTKTLGADVSTNNSDFLTFSSLTVGNLYRFSGVVTFQFNSSDDFFRVLIREGTTDVKSIDMSVGTHASATRVLAAGFTHTFVATATSVTLRTGALGGGDLVKASTAANATWAILEELNNTEVTTAW